jgi:hypothetical protein
MSALTLAGFYLFQRSGLIRLTGVAADRLNLSAEASVCL